MWLFKYFMKNKGGSNSASKKNFIFLKDNEKKVKTINITENNLKIKNVQGIVSNLEKDFLKAINKNFIYIPEKNIIFNKELVSCFLDTNKVNIMKVSKGTSTEKIKKDLTDLYKNTEAGSFLWDNPTIQEFRRNFISNNKFIKTGMDKGYYSVNSSTSFNIKNYFNNVGLENSINGDVKDLESDGILFPIARLAKKEDIENFLNNDILYNYDNKKIIEVMINNDLLPERIAEENKYLDILYLGNEKTFIGEYIGYLNKKENFLRFNLEKYIRDNYKWEKDTLVEIIYFNDEREEVFPDGKSIYYFKNGEVEERTYKDGVLSGEAILLYPNGEKEKRTYNNNKLETKTTYYFLNGDYEIREYKNNILEGNATYYFKNGVKEERVYVNGILNGEAIEYSNGKKRKYLYTNGNRDNPELLKYYIDIEKKRVNLPKENENIFFNPNNGHWELFNEEKRIELENVLEGKVYGRDPRKDIKEGGIVGIDFGTKSTVVAFQEDKEQILPMRIGGNIDNTPSVDDYENPTVIEFKNFSKFINEYNSRLGRPFTHWEDITVSHTAFQNLVASENEDFDSFIFNLKQWTNSKDEKIIIRDREGIEKEFSPYLEIPEDELDPIEIYAYYIGNYINNIKNGIYLQYLLSFPVTYEKEIRNKILKSFEKGIKKSLPEVVLKDENCMKNFKVRHGANEPAAYAICALQEYKFIPKTLEEKVYYGIFDFGGGTTDFDFGVWMKAENEEDFDNVLEHFGAGGDSRLGGENILKELAFEIFKENIEKLRERKIYFTRPDWCDRFVGDETVINNESVEAKFNMKQLSEKIRPLWESQTNEKTNNSIKITLYNENKEEEKDFELTINIKYLQEIIRKKIESGVKNFFLARDKAFKGIEIDKFNVLLAGNASKHPYVKEIFNTYAKEEKEKLSIFPPLGTDEADKLLVERGVVIKNMLGRATAKTGVAFGLIKARKTNRIHIIDRDEENNDTREIKFKYYVGFGVNGEFRAVLNPNTPYDEPILLHSVKDDSFEIYYTALPEASTNKMKMSDSSIRRKMQALDEDYGLDTKIYLKILNPTVISYIVTKDNISNVDKYLEEGDIYFE